MIGSGQPSEARALAVRFDTRNGNESYAENLEESVGLLDTLRTSAPIPSDD